MSEEVRFPELPEPHGVMPALVLPSEHGMGGGTTVYRPSDVYTADQMRAYARAAITQEREACAAKCDRVAWSWDEQRQFAQVAHDCAAAIRGQAEGERG